VNKRNIKTNTVYLDASYSDLLYKGTELKESIRGDMSPACESHCFEAQWLSDNGKQARQIITGIVKRPLSILLRRMSATPCDGCGETLK